MDKSIKSLDDVGGLLTAEWNDSKIQYDIRKINNYCNEYDIDPSELSVELLKQLSV